jgi:hypothetical protein
MPSAKDVTVSTEFIKVMSIGEPGTGKSIFASSFPTPGFVFDFANSIISYKGLDFDYEQFDLSPLGWTKAEKDVVSVSKAVKEGKYVTVVIDDVYGESSAVRSQKISNWRATVASSLFNGKKFDGGKTAADNEF